jgi:predicted short-subunit dehydrogenase-like oxidoreductase (DUF2520 family)
MRELERHPTDTHEPSGPLPPIVVIGRGRVGGSLASAAAVAGLDVRQVGREDIDAGCSEAEIALICVPDGAIVEVAERISRHVPRLRLVGHTSGATGLEALAPCVAAGATPFSLHPLQTIPDDRSPVSDAPAAIASTDPNALETATALAHALGMRPFTIDDEARATYHAAASIASNFLIVLEESAAALLGRAGVADARELLAPLVLRSAANWAERGGKALTGPIARGDRETVDRHLAALREHAPELLAMYEALAERTRELAEFGAAAVAAEARTTTGADPGSDRA